MAAALALLALGLALRGRWGWWIVWFGAGLLSATYQVVLPDGELTQVDRNRPVTLIANRAGAWQSFEEGWSAELQTRYVTQGRQVTFWKGTVFLFLPDPDAIPPPGTRIRARGYLRRSEGLHNRVLTEAGPWRMSLKTRRFLDVTPGGWRWRVETASVRIRSGLELRLASAPVASRGAAIARTLLLGDRRALPQDVMRGLRRAGLAHLTALSGLHVGMLALLVFTAGFRLPWRVRILIALLAIAVYLWIAIPRWSLIRASLMASLAALSLVGRRPPQLVNALSVVVLAVVLTSPRALHDLGFCLSVAATGGILLLAPAIVERWNCTSIWGRGLAVTVSAQLATLPWALSEFHLVSLTAPLLNLVAVPWTGGVLAACILWVGVSSISAQLGDLILALLDLLAAPFFWPALLPPRLSLSVPVHSAWWMSWVVAFCGMTVALTLPRLRRNAVLVVVALGLMGWELAPAAPRDPTLTMLDVGQGEAILLQDGGRAALVDGGGWRVADIAGRVLVPALAAYGVHSLDAVVLSHGDTDHCRGLVEILSYVAVGELWMAPGWKAPSCAEELALSGGLRVGPLWRGEQRRLGRWRLETLQPEAGARREGNDSSLVLLAQVRGRRFLLTGDLEAEGELRLMRKVDEAGLRADVLKLAHHGSNSSTTARFLLTVRPRLALASAGRRNRYGHPSTRVTERLAKYGVPLFRTDLHGATEIAVLQDGRLQVSWPSYP